MPVVKRKSAKTDPELLRQMKSASASEEPVVGIFRIKPDNPKKLVNSPERTEELAAEVLDRVRKRIGYSANRFNVLRNVGVVVVSAKPPFLEQLRREPEIVAAVANRHDDSPLIPPINKRPVPSATSGRTDAANGHGKKATTSKKTNSQHVKFRVAARRAGK